MNLRDEEFLKLRKGIMVFSPEFLSIEDGITKLKKIFHEIAHHQLNRPMANIDEDGIRMHENDADEIAVKKAIEEIHHLKQTKS
jgi:hypothetical protein